MPTQLPQLPTIELFREILRGQKRKSKATLKLTGRYWVSAATFKGLVFVVKDGELRTHAHAAGELQLEWEGRVWTIVRATAVKSGVLVEYE